MFSKKPTIFFSNQKLNLKKEHIKSNDKMRHCSYNERASIPKELILDIIKQL